MFLIIFSLCAQNSRSQQVFSPANGDPKLAKIVETVQMKYHLPALAVSIVSDGKVWKSAAVGHRKVDDPILVTVSDQFHIGSCTKSMTATLVAMLVERGKVKWESTVSESSQGPPPPGVRGAECHRFFFRRNS